MRCVPIGGALRAKRGERSGAELSRRGIRNGGAGFQILTLKSCKL